MLPIYIACGVIAVGVVVLFARTMGGGRKTDGLPPPPDDFGLRRDPFGLKTPPPKPDGPRGSPFDPPGLAKAAPSPADDAAERALHQLRVEVFPLLLAGDKIGAIKLVRMRTGASLADAKNTVESWMTPRDGAKRSASAVAFAEQPDVPSISIEARPALLAEVAAIAQGDRIAAIKRWRQATGAGLAASKDLVDALVTNGAAGVPGDTLLAAWPDSELTPPPASAEPMPFPTGEPSPPQRGRFDAEPLGDAERAALLAECVAIARGGNKIEAIKRYRERTGLGLKDAKDAIDRAM